MRYMNDRLSLKEFLFIMGLLTYHVFLFPLALSFAVGMGLTGDLGDTELNFIYYASSLLLTFIFAGKYLRRSFDNLLDNPKRALTSFLLAWAIYLGLNAAINSILIFIPFFAEENPNQASIEALVVADRGVIASMTVFMAPIVEEVIFRGGLFCGLHRRSRVLAYAVSILVFSLYHVWQYALLADARMLLFAIQYVPASFALCWCYERSGSIWAAIAFHMSINALGVIMM